MLVQALRKDLFSVVRSGSRILNSGGIFGSYFNPSFTRKGASVNDQTVFQLSGFYKGVNTICNDYAKLPKYVIQEKNGANTVYHLEHPLNKLINDRPNPCMNAWGFDSILLKSAIIRGNGYAEIKRNLSTGKMTSLEYLDEKEHPVTVRKYEDKLFYHYKGRVLHADDVVHYRSPFSENGITGMGIVTYAAKSLGVALSSQEFAQDYYDSKGMGTVVVTTDKDLTPSAKNTYSSALAHKLSDGEAFKVAVVDDGFKFHNVQLTAQESQFLETNKQAIHEIANWLGLPVYKLGVIDNLNNNNMEHLAISYVSDSIIPWAQINEQEYNAKLFSPKETQQGYKVKFDTEILLQADRKTQGEYYQKLVYSGIITPNMAANKLGFPALEGGDERLIPVNMQTQSQLNKNLNENAS